MCGSSFVCSFYEFLSFRSAFCVAVWTFPKQNPRSLRKILSFHFSQSLCVSYRASRLTFNEYVPYDMSTICTEPLLVSVYALHVCCCVWFERRSPSFLVNLSSFAYGHDRSEIDFVRTGSLVLSWLPTRAVSVTLLIEVGAIYKFPSTIQSNRLFISQKFSVWFYHFDGSYLLRLKRTNRYQLKYIAFFLSSSGLLVFEKKRKKKSFLLKFKVLNFFLSNEFERFTITNGSFDSIFLLFVLS